jgi:hypothetical protein
MEDTSLGLIEAMTKLAIQAASSLREHAPSPTEGSPQVTALVHATNSIGRNQSLEYSVTVTERDGRWDVAEVRFTPPRIGRRS